MLARLFRPVRAAASALPIKPAAPARPKGTVAAADPLQIPAPQPPTAEVEGDGPVGNLDRLAVISGRDCLAFQGEACTVCHDRCPVPGSIVIVDGLPQVEPAVCVGCGVCHDVCPAPDTAVRVVPRPPGLPRPASALIPPPGASQSAPPSPPASHSPFPSLDPRPDVEDV